ncbi:dihydroneopterin triphosphate diphosphatase [Cupriavidus taiwanensis]|uniref:dATP pyrophosphohydrolase n=1 Tax=Cupriavidus taiwanensis (strain DSM 17343 / BCRC 17206 / CCUG 44338 / CIP 107171 / LMG 19424 / R1) TaxID=977880 RepID=B2AH17_CUPTR|nr:dihydroneopterin triphosphate diphosphatase [Cupriavidus taiwanensis]CAP63066.1 dATP pyrophosphohydrolase [Cupriavidus taiwanensis LMG 19424]
MSYKIPESVLVVIYTPDLQVLLLERADRPGFWQSVTGSLDTLDEPLALTAAREVAEETGIIAGEHQLTDWGHAIQYDIYPQWRHRYAEGVTRNTEHWFGLRVAAALPVTLAPREHLQYKWLPWQQAAQQCFSSSNAEAIRQLAWRAGKAGAPAAADADAGHEATVGGRP